MIFLLLLPHWLFWEDTEVSSALKPPDFPEQMLHVAHQLSTLRKGTDSLEILHILSVVTLLFFQQENPKMSSVSPQRAAGGEELRQGQENSLSQVLDCAGSALCSWQMSHPSLLQRVIGLCKVTHQDKKRAKHFYLSSHWPCIYRAI